MNLLKHQQGISLALVHKTKSYQTRKKSFQSKLPTEVCYKPYCVYIFAKISVCYKPYCVYIFAKKKLSKQGCVTVAEVPQRRQKIQSKTKQGNRRKVAWRDVRPKFRKARDTVEAKRSKVFLGKAKSSPEKRKKKKPKSYSGRLLTASGGRQ